MWAEANNYIYRGRLVASTKGGTLNEKPEIILREDPEPDGKLLEAIKTDEKIARGTIRISLGPENTLEDADAIAAKLRKIIVK